MEIIHQAEKSAMGIIGKIPPILPNPIPIIPEALQ
jgi:hypothetical protein